MNKIGNGNGTFRIEKKRKKSQIEKIRSDVRVYDMNWRQHTKCVDMSCVFLFLLANKF